MNPNPPINEISEMIDIGSDTRFTVHSRPSSVGDSSDSSCEDTSDSDLESETEQCPRQEGTRPVNDQYSGYTESQASLCASGESSYELHKANMPERFSGTYPPKVNSTSGQKVDSTDNKCSYTLFQEDDFYDMGGMSRSEFRNDVIQIDLAGDIIENNFVNDLEMHNMRHGLSEGQSMTGVAASLEAIRDQPILHIKGPTPATPAATDQSLTTPRPIVRRDSSLLEITSLSQTSFVKEILEIHEKIVSGNPNPTATSTPCTSTQQTKPSAVAKKETAGINMATQTESNVIPELPIRRHEFECQVEYLERALFDHERRLRCFEVWQDKIERRIEGIDAEYFNSYKSMKIEHDAMLSEMRDLREVVRTLLDEAKNKGCQCNGCCGKATQREPAEPLFTTTRPVQASAADNPRESVCLPIHLNNDNQKRAQKKEGEKLASTFDSFMTAASKMIPVSTPPNPRASVPDSVPTKNIEPLPMRALRQPKPRSSVPAPPGYTKKAADMGRSTSTPRVREEQQNISWADVGNDEDNVIDDFIASIVIQDGKCVDNSPTRENASATHRNKAATQSDMVKQGDTKKGNEKGAIQKSSSRTWGYGGNPMKVGPTGGEKSRTRSDKPQSKPHSSPKVRAGEKKGANTNDLGG